MRLDSDIKAMSVGQTHQELMRVRQLVRTHRDREGNARCHHADEELYARVLPEQKPAGRMDGDKEVILRDCSRYIDRQQCADCPISRRHAKNRQD